MKKQYFRKANNIGFQGRGVTASPPFSIGLGISIMVLVLCVFIRLVAPQTFLTLVTPLITAGTRLTAAVGVATNTESTEALRAKVDTLEKEHTELSNQNTVLASKVEDLTRLLGTRITTERGILAGVVARPPVAPYGVLILDQGRDAGVEENAFVYGPGGVPMGRITQTTARSSRASLFSLTGTTTAGWVGVQRVPVNILGEGAGAFSAILPKEAGIVVGDVLYVVSGGALPIGVVSSIENDPSSPNVTLRILPYVNPFSVTDVTIDRHAH